MAKVLLCDVCGKHTDRIAAKLWYADTGGPQRIEKYTHHLDVGECCHERIQKVFRWRERQTAAEYQNRGKPRKVSSGSR